MEKHILILAATHDFLWKFERENVKILQGMGYVVHYAANMKEPHYISHQEQFRQMGVRAHHIEITRSGPSTAIPRWAACWGVWRAGFAGPESW